MAMPSTRPPPQGAFQFLGVNLRRAREHLEDQELARAINADLHTMPGNIVLRLGRQRHDGPYLGVNGQALEIRRLAKINGQRYRVGGHQVFRGPTAITAGLRNEPPRLNETTMLAFRPLGDDQTYAFIADLGEFGKDNGRTYSPWGISAPAAAPILSAGAAGSPNGTYRVLYTYVRLSATGGLAHESNPSPESAAVSL